LPAQSKLRDRLERSNVRALGWLTLSLLPVGVFAACAWSRRWISDDGLINVRIINNILAGHGPVANVGERVEAHTSTLWVLISSLPGLVGVDVASAMVVVGIALSVGGLGLGLVAAARLHGDSRPAESTIVGMFPLGAVIYAAIPAGWDYASSGLETGLALAWLGGCFYLLARLVPDPDPEYPAWHWYATAVVLGLGPLIRPELALFSFAFLAPLLLGFFSEERGGFDLRGLLGLGVAMGTLPILYQLFRMGYYAAPVPNTAYAKEAFESRWQQGGHYFNNFFGLYWLALPLALAAIPWASEAARACVDRGWRRLSLIVLPTLCGIGYCIYVVKVGGGFMHGRLFLPGVFGMLLPIAVIPLKPPKAAPPTVVARAAVTILIVGWALYCGLFIRVAQENEHGIGDERGWWARHAGVDNPVTAEDFEDTMFHRDVTKLREMAVKHCPRAFGEPGGCDPLVYARPVKGVEFKRLFPSRKTYPLREDIGKRGVALAARRLAMGIRGVIAGPEIHLVDAAGLADPLASRLKLAHRGRPGHEKSLSDIWLVARFAQPSEDDDPRVQAARRALGCGELAELLDAVEGPLTSRQFVTNMVSAFRFHELRVDPDPFVAEQTFCETVASTTKMRGGRGGTARQWRCGQGQAMRGVEVRTAKDVDGMRWLRPLCAQVEHIDDALVLGDEYAPSPGFGKNRGGRRQRLECPTGTTLVGLRGGASKAVERISLICVDANGEEAALTGPFQELGSGGEDFELRCPDGEIATGAATRAGALIDAVGLVCGSTPG
jgi:arabinofuranosyltransferase